MFRRVSSTSGDSLETVVRAVTMIPGAGERAYDTKVQKRDLGGGSTTPENDSAGRSTSDWSVALDDLKASLPNVDTVFLVVGWFGDDLRCGSCTIRQGRSRQQSNDARRLDGSRPCAIRRARDVAQRG